jgi:Holliday junction resolvasome RuvABC ATP-dependent DNA helicase subunit
MRPLRWLQLLPAPGKELPHRQCLVLVRLALAMNRDGTGFVATDRLAAEAGVSADTVTRAIDWAMNDAGILDRTSRGHRITDKHSAASTYRLLP